jgi:hypothetical protein
MGLLLELAMADKTWQGWLGVAGLLTLMGLLTLAHERAMRHTLTSLVASAEPGTFVMDRRRGRTLVVLKPFDVRPQSVVILTRRQM